MPTAETQPPPLRGIRVLDLSRALAAPFCAMMLGDLGADVIKVEHPDGGDQSRTWGARLQGGERTYFLTANRNKRTISIDFSKPEGAALIKSLARHTDVLVENYLLGSLAKRGLDYESLARENPGLIYCSVSGYGRTGPMAQRAGYDGVIQAESGLMSVTGDISGSPTKVGMAFSDITAGMYAAQGILAALVGRSHTGLGQLVDVSMLDCTIANLGSVAANALLLDKAPGRFGNGHADVVPQDLFATSDGHIMLHIGTDEQFQRFCRAVLQSVELADDARFMTNDARRLNRNALSEAITAHLSSRNTSEWSQLCENAGISAGPVRNVLQALRATEIEQRGLVREVVHPTAGPIKLVGTPLKLSRSQLDPISPPPLLGEHTNAILECELGLSVDQISGLRDRGIVG